MSRQAVLTLILVLAVFAAGGCGGGEDKGSDPRREAAEQFVENYTGADEALTTYERRFNRYVRLSQKCATIAEFGQLAEASECSADAWRGMPDAYRTADEAVKRLLDGDMPTDCRAAFGELKTVMADEFALLRREARASEDLEIMTTAAAAKISAAHHQATKRYSAANAAITRECS